MNETIVKIVNLLFEDIEDNEEVRAIREEVLTNCQERYQDMIESGLTEDESIHSVVESLKGMEDMLKPYPRKQAEADAPTQKEWTFNPAEVPIHKVSLIKMARSDVQVKPSHDGLIHVLCNNPELNFITEINEGALTVCYVEDLLIEEPHHNKVSVDLNDLGGLFRKWAERFIGTVSRLNGAKMTLLLPISVELHVGTASGDVKIDGVTLQSLHVLTASGDIDITAVTVHGDVKLSSASGDIDAEYLSAAKLHVNTASGDLEILSAKADAVKLNSASGDQKLSGTFEEVQFNTASGDTQLRLDGDHLHSVNGNAASGDLHVQLPPGIDAAISCRSHSGDIRQRIASNPASSVQVQLRTNSGDITVK